MTCNTISVCVYIECDNVGVCLAYGKMEDNAYDTVGKSGNVICD